MVIVVILIVVEGAGDGSNVVVLMMMRGGNRDSSRKPEVAAKAGVVGLVLMVKLEVVTQAGVVFLVLMVMRGRGGRTMAGARGIREKRRGGEGDTLPQCGECMQKGRDTLRLSGWGEGVKLVQVVTMVGAGVSGWCFP